VSPAPDRGVSPDPIEAMAAALAASNPTLYRHLALYLQVLRQVLPMRVEQACFHLATQVHPQRYAALAAPERSALHGRILALVQRCSSLLTVEQLTALAKQIDREAQFRQRREQLELLKRLSAGSDPDDTDPDDADPDDADPDPDDEGEFVDQQIADPSEDLGFGAASSELPAGSIRLGFALPLSADIGSWRAMGPASPGLAGSELHGEADHSGPRHGRGSSAGREDSAASADFRSDDAGAERTDPQIDRDHAGAADDDLDATSFDTSDLESSVPDSVAFNADVDLEPEEEEPAEESLQQRLAQGSDSAAILRIVREAMENPMDHGLHKPPSPAGPGSSSPWSEARLPRDPIALLRWLDGFDKALLRRLRNLSHALNVELLRVGISRGLLPVSLLDAVLEGQVDTMASPSNLLHLQLPFSLRPGLAEVHALAILLRPVDLEMDEPRLRTCRRRLQQQRQELRRMAHQFRRLQRRLQAHEAERLWLQDIRNSPPPKI
jgi:hypothetical protein